MNARGRPLGKPQVFFENIVVAPTIIKMTPNNKARIKIKPSPVGEGGSTERLAEVETDEVFVT